MMSQLPKNACIYPFKAAMLQHGIPATPCCRFHSRFLGQGDNENIDAYGASFADIRETMMRNEWHPGCFKCKADEETKGSSMRTEADDLFKDFDAEPKLQYLEITVGRLCNLACYSCGPEFSHTWDKDAVEFDVVTKHKLNLLKNLPQELDLDNIDTSLLKELKHIKVTGGEPFLHRQFVNLVVRLAKEGLAPQIKLEIFTNCTWYPGKLEMDSLLQFKKVKLMASLDGYGGVNELIRYPSKWDKVEGTLDKWIDVREKYSEKKLVIGSATTVNVINAPHMFEYMHWARVHKGILVVLQTVYEPHHLSITHWPDWYKKTLDFTIEQQYKGWNNRAGKLKPAYDLLKRLCQTKTTKHQVKEDKSEKYIDTMVKQFNHRKQNIEDAPLFLEILRYNDRQV